MAKQCEGKSSRTGLPCKRKAGYGTTHPGEGNCTDHETNTPGAVLVKARAAASLRRSSGGFYGSPVDISPAEALLQEVRRAAGIVEWLTEKLGLLEDELPEMSSVIEFDKGGTVYSSDRAEWLKLYLAERQHLVRTAKLALDAGVAAEHVKIARQQAGLVVMAIRQVLDQLGLDENQQTLVGTVVPGVLRALASNSHPSGVVQDPPGAARSRETPRNARERV